MSNPNKDKGRRAELAVGRYLNGQGWAHAEPTRRSGWSDDRGDIDGLPGVCLEVKAAQHFRREEWLAELAAEMVNARCQVGAVIVKRWGTTEVGDWYALMPVSILASLLHDAGY